MIKFSTAVRNTVILVNGVSNPNLMRTAIIALGDLLALMIRRAARLPLEYVAVSLVVAKRTVVVNNVTLSTYHVGLPLIFVSDFGLLVAILSPMSVYVTKYEKLSIRCAQKAPEDNNHYAPYGLLTNMSRRPSK